MPELEPDPDDDDDDDDDVLAAEDGGDESGALPSEGVLALLAGASGREPGLDPRPPNVEEDADGCRNGVDATESGGALPLIEDDRGGSGWLPKPGIEVVDSTVPERVRGLCAGMREGRELFNASTCSFDACIMSRLPCIVCT